MRLLTLLLISVSGAFAQAVPPMQAAVPLPTPKVQFFDTNGKVVSGGKVCTYAAGTSTPLATYTDSTGVTPNANPVVLDAGGFANIWVKGEAYKIVLRKGGDGTCSTGSVIWTADNVTDATFFYLTHLQSISDSSLLSYSRGGTGALTRTVRAKLQESVSVKDFGATGDGATDDTAAFQAAIDAMTTNGGRIYMPAGTYRTTAPLVWPANNKQITLAGDGALASIIHADFSSATETAAILAVGTNPSRAFPDIRDLSIYGNNEANVIGIHIKYGSQFASLSNLYLYNLGKGAQFSYNYKTSVYNVVASSNVYDGLNFGTELGGALCTGGGNVFDVAHSSFGSNGRYGIYVCASRNSALTGTTVESNGTANLHAYFAKGLALNSTYSESSGALTTDAQFVFDSCEGVSVNGVNVSNWRTGSTVFRLNSTSSASFTGTSVEFNSANAGTAFSLTNSVDVAVQGTFRNITTALSGTGSRARLSAKFDAVTTPVNWSAGSGDTLFWDQLSSAEYAASTIGATAPVMLRFQTGEVRLYNSPLTSYGSTGPYFSKAGWTFGTVESTAAGTGAGWKVVRPNNIRPANVKLYNGATLEWIAGIAKNAGNPSLNYCIAPGPEADDSGPESATCAFYITPAGVVSAASSLAVGNDLALGDVLFADLGTPINGTVKYCSNCTIANPCASGGGGAIAKRLGGAWVCN